MESQYFLRKNQKNTPYPGSDAGYCLVFEYIGHCLRRGEFKNGDVMTKNDLAFICLGIHFSSGFITDKSDLRALKSCNVAISQLRNKFGTPKNYLNLTFNSPQPPDPVIYRQPSVHQNKGYTK